MKYVNADYVNKVIEHRKIAPELRDSDWEKFSSAEETKAVLFVIPKFAGTPTLEELTKEANCYIEYLNSEYSERGVYKYAPALGCYVKIADAGKEIDECLFPVF